MVASSKAIAQLTELENAVRHMQQTGDELFQDIASETQALPSSAPGREDDSIIPELGRFARSGLVQEKCNNGLHGPRSGDASLTDEVSNTAIGHR